MIDKEIAELRRRFRPDRSSITHVLGCYVNNSKEIIATFDQSMALADQEEAEKYLNLLRKALTGSLQKNLLDITFRTAQVLDSPEHRLLTSLKDSALKDEEAVQKLFETIVSSLQMEDNYVILMAHDVYDVPYKGRDGGSLEDASETQFSYIICSICPVKLSKPALHYVAEESLFHNRKADWVVGQPELGFLFPAFDDRATNLYNALYYTRSATENHPELVEALFHTDAPMPAAAQKETFGMLLSDNLEEACSFDVVQTVQSQLRDLIQEHKESREPEPLAVNRYQIEGVLESCGVPKDSVEAFGKQFDAEFGEGAEVSPGNIVDTRRLQVETPDVTIQINPDRQELVETRVIGGTPYILIRADEGVEVNGVQVHVAEP